MGHFTQLKSCLAPRSLYTTWNELAIAARSFHYLSIQYRVEKKTLWEDFLPHSNGGHSSGSSSSKRGRERIPLEGGSAAAAAVIWSLARRAIYAATNGQAAS